MGWQQRQERWLCSPLHSAELVPSSTCVPRESTAGCTEPWISVPLYHPMSPALEFPREQKEQDPGSVAGARICASLKASWTGSGIPLWLGVTGHLSPPSAACQTPACATQCPYKGREKLKSALSECFLPPFRLSPSALAMAAAQQDPAAPVPKPGRARDPVKLQFPCAEDGDGVCPVASLASSQRCPDARAML